MIQTTVGIIQQKQTLNIRQNFLSDKAKEKDLLKSEGSTLHVAISIPIHCYNDKANLEEICFSFSFVLFKNKIPRPSSTSKKKERKLRETKNDNPRIL